MKILAHDNIELGINETIQIFFENPDNTNIVQINGDGSIVWIQDKDSDILKKGKYTLAVQNQ